MPAALRSAPLRLCGVFFVLATAMFLGCQDEMSTRTRVIRPIEQRKIDNSDLVPWNGSGASSEPAVTTASAPAAYHPLGRPEDITGGQLQINQEFLTVADILGPLARPLRHLGAAPPETFRRQALPMIAQEIRDQVSHSLLFGEADRRLNDDEKKYATDEYDKRYKLALAESGGSRATLAERLSREGLTLEKWEKEYKNSLLIQVYVQKRFGQQVTVNRRMMMEYYTSHQGEFSLPQTAQMQIIDVPVRVFLPTSRPAEDADIDEARKLARKEIQAAAAEIAEGKDFGQVAKKYSRSAKAEEGGVWPAMERGSFKSEQVEEVAFAQKPGQVSEIIETKNDFYIVKTLQAAAGKAVPFEDVQARIEETLRRQAYDKQLGKHLEELRTESLTKSCDQFTQACLEMAVKKFCR